MTGDIAAQALAYACRGCPVFPCQPGRKEPATRHGFRDATTDPDKITWWWRREPDANLAVATGAPGPDVLDVDQHGAAGNGFTALGRLRQAGLVQAASTIVSTPSGGLHVYFTGSDQPSGRLRRHHLDFRARGGYVLAPPSRVGGKHYRVEQHLAGTGGLDWANVTELLEPERTAAIRPAVLAGADLSHLVSWVASLRPDSHNRNDGLFWAACRAAGAGDEAVLAGLAAAARTTGLTEREIRRTIDSARRTAGLRPCEHDASREGTS
jgi:Bifunctional DNA primase/polymerase, N-terminal